MANAYDVAWGQAWVAGGADEAHKGQSKVQVHRLSSDASVSKVRVLAIWLDRIGTHGYQNPILLMAVTKVFIKMGLKGFHRKFASAWSSSLQWSSYYSADCSHRYNFYNEFGGVISDPLLN